MELVFVYLLFCAMVLGLARHYGRSGFNWFVIALIVSPVIAGFVLLIMGRPRDGGDPTPHRPDTAAQHAREDAAITPPAAAGRDPVVAMPKITIDRDTQPPPAAKPLRAMHKRPKIPGFETVLGPESGEEALDIEPIYGLVTGIEYADANGELSRRRISFSEITDTGVIDAYCFERKAPRRFKVERVRKFYDLDGREFTPKEYFAMMRTADARLEITEKMRPPVWQSHWREILTLSVMARVDGVMEDSETATILEAVSSVLASEGVEMGPAEESALTARIRRIKAEPELALRAAKGISKKPMAIRLRLIAAAEAVMDADGIRDPEERAFFADLRAQLNVD